MGETITLDFTEPIPVFPLPGVVLLPHASQLFNIFEPRYCQMIEDCLARMRDGELLSAGPIAIGSFSPRSPKGDDKPIIRSAVCVGKIIGHDSLLDGRHHVLIHGVCRSRIRKLMEPEGERLYRVAMLEPLERGDAVAHQLTGVRRTLKQLINGPRLKRLTGAKAVLEWIAQEEVSTHALLELIGAKILGDDDVRYRLLAEPDAASRAAIIRKELLQIDRLVAKGDEQHWQDWPKGISWN